eukprot:1219631-Prymnesium_polylepis.1
MGLGRGQPDAVEACLGRARGVFRSTRDTHSDQQLVMEYAAYLSKSGNRDRLHECCILSQIGHPHRRSFHAPSVQPQTVLATCSFSSFVHTLVLRHARMPGIRNQSSNFGPAALARAFADRRQHLQRIAASVSQQTAWTATYPGS